MRVIIDNYDSFTYNLYQYIGAIAPEVTVYRNDKITVEELAAMRPSHIILSPGPGYPKAAGICEELIQALSGRIPILGICLGHQAIGEAFGGRIVHAPRLMHGKADAIRLDAACPLFAELPEQTEVGRYHSLVVDRDTLPDCLRETASASDGSVMAVQHVTHPTFGIQFHPESILTPDGLHMIERFMKLK